MNADIFLKKNCFLYHTALCETDILGDTMEFLTTKGIAASIERIIRNATDFIVIVSPYVKIDRTYLERLHEAEQNNIKIYLIFGKGDMKNLEKEKLQVFQNLQILFLENLHAKCYMNENTLIISSMNLHKYSEENNREMGIEIHKNENPTMYEDIKKEVVSIKNSAKEYILNNQRPLFQNNIHYNNNHFQSGYCIRCRKRIDFDLDRPLCNNCYQEWAQYGNDDYPENYCHICGAERNFNNQVDYAHPCCYDCWRNLQP